MSDPNPNPLENILAARSIGHKIVAHDKVALWYEIRL
jgi:hypothetical protein